VSPDRGGVAKRALVMGLGSFGGGAGAARHLVSMGYSVTATDLRPASALTETLKEVEDLPLELVLGEHRPQDFDSTDLLVVNPAVAPDHPLIARARNLGGRITSEIELFLEAVRARLICVTGTQGKSSTAHILAQLLRSCGFTVHLGGNMGGSLLHALDEIAASDCCIVELSSYQLEALPDPAALGVRIERIEAVCITNVLADHLERHATPESYAAAKRKILELADEDSLAFLPADDRRMKDWPTRAHRVPFADRPVEGGLFQDEGAFHFAGDVLGYTRDLRLPGRFQRINALCALGMAHAVGADAAALRTALGQVRGLPHRMENLGVFRGRRVIDNAVSTTPDSTFAVLREVADGTCLLVGGRRKQLPLDELAHLAHVKGVSVVAFGEARHELASEFAARGSETIVAAELEEALARAFELTTEGGCILFSPACSSFDTYPNFRARAEAFQNALPPRDP
jgi:UDP-N-acetylmuramoylalanine--D-glutamate ligase